MDEMKLNILLIDDMKPLLTVMEKALKMFGQNLFPADSGSRGLEIFETTPIDVIVCDIEMAGMDGWEVAKLINESCTRRKIPRPVFILLTGWSSKSEIEDKKLSHGVDRILIKPVEIVKLLDVLQELTRKKMR